MSFLSPKSDIPTTSPERQTYEATGPVPVVFGRGLVGLKMIESPFNHQQIDHGDKSPKGNTYSLVGLGFHGPVDRLFRVWINGKPVWQLAAIRGAEDYVDIHVPEWQSGNAKAQTRARIYWGKEDQPADPFLNNSVVNGKQPPVNSDGSPRYHPPYAGLFYIIFYNLHFDFPGDIAGSTALPTIECDVFVRPPGDTGDPVYSNGSNAIPITREILKNKIWGGGLPDAMLPQTDWDSAASDFNTDGYFGLNGGNGHLSPVLAENKDLAEHLADFFGYYDGYLRLRDGKLYPGWFPSQGFDPGTITTLNRHDCIGEPDVDPEGWEDTLNEVTVRYREPDEQFGDASVTERSTYNLQVTGRPARESVSAPAVLNPWQGRHLASRKVFLRSEPRMKSRITVLRSKAHNPDGSLLMPGDLVYFNYAPYALQQLCRIVEREDGSDVLLGLQAEPGRYPENYVAVDDPREHPRIAAPSTITDWRVWELTADCAGRLYPPIVAIIARRPSDGIIGAKVWISGDGNFSGEEAELEQLSVWGTKAVLGTALDDDDAQLYITGYDPDDLPDELNRDYSDAEKTAGYMLALIDDELIALGAIAAAATESTRTYVIARGARDTVAAAHAQGVDVWLFTRAAFERMVYEHDAMKWPVPWSASTAKAWLRLSSANGYEVGDPNTPVEVSFRQVGIKNYSVVSRASVNGGLRLTPSWDGSSADESDWLHIQTWDSAGNEAVADHWIEAAKGTLDIDFPVEKANHHMWLRGWPVRKINGVNAYGPEIWGAYSGQDPTTIQIQPDTKAPGTVSSLAVSFDSSHYENTLTWGDPPDDDIKALRVYLSIDGGSANEIAVLQPGVKRFVDKYVAGVGGTQSYEYSVIAGDKSENLGLAASVSVNVPELPSGGLPTISEVTGCMIIARASTSQGTRFYAQWTGDGAFLDRIKIVGYPINDKSKGFGAVEFPLGTSGTLTADLPVSSNDSANGQQWQFYVQRGDTEEGITFYSQRTSITANMIHYNSTITAPTTNGSPEFNSLNYSVKLPFIAPAVGELKELQFQFSRNNSTWVDLPSFPASSFVYGDLEGWQVHQDVYPDPSQRPHYYRMRSVGFDANGDDVSGNVSAWVNFTPITIDPQAFSGSISTSVTGLYQQAKCSWNEAVSTDDVFRILIENPADSEEHVIFTIDVGSGPQSIVKDVPWSGNASFMASRGTMINGRRVWSAWATLTNQTIARFPAPSYVTFNVSGYGVYHTIEMEWVGGGSEDTLQFQLQNSSDSTQSLIIDAPVGDLYSVETLRPEIPWSGSTGVRYRHGHMRENKRIWSRWTSWVNYTVRDWPQASAVQNLAATQRTNGIQLNWDEPVLTTGGLKGYEVQFARRWYKGVQQSLAWIPFRMVPSEETECLFQDRAFSDLEYGYEFRVIPVGITGIDGDSATLSKDLGYRVIGCNPVHSNVAFASTTVSSVSSTYDRFLLGSAVGFRNFEPVRFTGTMPGGLTENKIYYLWKDGIYYKVLENIWGDPINLTSTGSGITCHRMKPMVDLYYARSTSTGNWNAGDNNELGTTGEHYFQTGDYGQIFTNNGISQGTMPTGFTRGKPYFIERYSKTEIRFYNSEEDYLDGNGPIGLGSSGTWTELLVYKSRTPVPLYNAGDGYSHSTLTYPARSIFEVSDTQVVTEQIPSGLTDHRSRHLHLSQSGNNINPDDDLSLKIIAANGQVITWGNIEVIQSYDIPAA